MHEGSLREGRLYGGSNFFNFFNFSSFPSAQVHLTPPYPPLPDSGPETDCSARWSQLRSPRQYRGLGVRRRPKPSLFSS